MRQLLFHEKCTGDVKQILAGLTQSRYYEDTPELQRSRFLSRLTEAYQLIFESPFVSSGQVFEIRDTFFNWRERIEKRFVKIQDFPYLVVYTLLPGRATVVLGIIGMAESLAKQ